VRRIAPILERPLRCLRRSALGVLAGAAALLVQGCSSLPLEPCHTVTLTAEFTVRKADEVRTFEDYRRLEDRLFAQLEEKVYARAATGPDHALVRYSKGSAADPQSRQPNWNRSFELSAAAPAGGVLLLHGMSDSPYSLRALGQTLHQRNFWVIGLRLPGHGTAPSGLLGVEWEDMAAAVKLSVEHLAAKVGPKPIHIIGYSTGAPLALDFALNALEGRTAPVPASLVLISPAIGLHPAAALASWKRRLSMLPGLGDLAWLQVLPEFDPYKYNSFTTNAGEQVHRLTRSVAGRIESRARSHPTRVAGDARLPFAVTLVTNETPDSPTAVARRQEPFSAEMSQTDPLGLAWPPGVISLSHVALPIPPDDPLYGQRPPENEDVLFLGQMAIQGERGLFILPSDWLLRIRHNPFYAYLEARVLAWMDRAAGHGNDGTGLPTSGGPGVGVTPPKQ